MMYKCVLVPVFRLIHLAMDQCSTSSLVHISRMLSLTMHISDLRTGIIMSKDSIWIPRFPWTAIKWTTFQSLASWSGYRYMVYKQHESENPMNVRSFSYVDSPFGLDVFLQDAGAFLERRVAGLSDVEIRCNQGDSYDFGNYSWGYQVIFY